MEFKVLVCKKCGNMVTYLNHKTDNIICCGENMKHLVAGSVDASKEKHIPVYEIFENTVKVKIASVEHPMEEKHYIKWIALLTNKGLQIKYLNPNEPAYAEFNITNDEKVSEVYEYCNLHGLWVCKAND